MNKVVNSVKSFLQDNSGPLLLICIFVFGFVSGGMIAFCNSELYISMIYDAVCLPASSITVLVHIIFPFLLTALIFISGKTKLFLAMCLMQSFMFGISSTAVIIAYGTSQWLISHLLLFTVTISLISLLWLWFRHISWKRTAAKKDFLICFSISILTAAVDQYLISPFLITLFI